MSQEIFDSIDPAISGTDLATVLNDFKDAVVSGFSGTVRPTELDPGGGWIDTTNDPTTWSYKIWTGTDDVEVFTINLSSGVAGVSLAVDSFIVKKISADTVGAFMELVKQRVASNGQVASGDIVGEIRFVGRTDTSTNPVVAYMKFTATDNMTASAYGGTLSFYSTPDGSAAATEHLRFINGLVETVVPHKVNSQVLGTQNVATAATIAQLSAAKVLVEMTGVTATDIQGINSAHDSKVVTIHNRSSAVVTLKHQNLSAAAEDRMKLPSSVDYNIQSESSATLFYCTTDLRWKLKATSDKFSGFSVDTYYGVTQIWTAPQNVASIKVRAFSANKSSGAERTGFIDAFGNAYAWGINTNGQLGLGDVTARSSPVAVLGGLAFERVIGSTAAAAGRAAIAVNGSAYAWGINTNGQLGVGDVVPRSSPVAVTGGLRFFGLYIRDASVLGISTSNDLYAWGINTNGQLGQGNVTPKSAPTAVLGSLKWADLIATSGANSSSAVVGLTQAGTAYAWGINTDGNLGVGDVTVRSSPVAVLGGLTFSYLGGGAVSSRYYSAALNTSGAAYAWGNNASGQLGLGDVTPRSSPIAVLGGLTFKQLITHEKSESIFGLTSAGALYAWGDNSQGVLGLGDIAARSSPVAVLGGLAFTKVRLFKSLAMGLTSDGTLYAWGINANGQLGNGDVVSRSSPVAVLGGLKFSEVFFADGSTDVYSVYGITPGGLLYAWGINTNGSLGLGDVTPRSSPVAVIGGFSADPRDICSNTDLTVTPGAAYTVAIPAGAASFGSTALGRDIYKVEIEYVS